MKLQYNIKPYLIKAINAPEEIAILDRIIPDLKDSKFAEFNRDFSFLESVVGIDVDASRLVVFCTKEVIAKYVRYSEIIGYKFKVFDATSFLFRTNLDMSKACEEMAENFEQLVREYIMKHFDADDVLDKMNEGFKLTELDKNILHESVARV